MNLREYKEDDAKEILRWINMLNEMKSIFFDLNDTLISFDGVSVYKCQ